MEWVNHPCAGGREELLRAKFHPCDGTPFLYLRKARLLWKFLPLWQTNSYGDICLITNECVHLRISGHSVTNNHHKWMNKNVCLFKKNMKRETMPLISTGRTWGDGKWSCHSLSVPLTRGHNPGLPPLPSSCENPRDVITPLHGVFACVTGDVNLGLCACEATTLSLSHVLRLIIIPLLYYCLVCACACVHVCVCDIGNEPKVLGMLGKW